jgi:hypothetical protein
MNYETYLDEITTLIAENYKLIDAVAIALVMKAQDDNFFIAHDENPALRTKQQAKIDAKTVYDTYRG